MPPTLYRATPARPHDGAARFDHQARLVEAQFFAARPGRGRDNLGVIAYRGRQLLSHVPNGGIPPQG